MSCIPINDFSLITLCDATKAGKLYSIVPDSGAGDFDVTRASTATYLGSDGLLKTAANNEPRIEFNPDGSYKGLLVEPAATNLALYSEEFDDAAWNKTNSTITLNTAISPNGASTASTLTATASTGEHNISFSLSEDSILRNRSVFVKKGTARYVAFSVIPNLLSTGQRYTVFDLETGVIVRPGSDSRAGFGYVVRNYGNGWYRISFNGFGTTLTRGFTIGIVDDNFASSSSWTANGTETIFLYGAQLEVGTVATSYIPTVASTVTRAADVISKTNASALISQGSGTILFRPLFDTPTEINVMGIIATVTNEQMKLTYSASKIELFANDTSVGVLNGTFDFTSLDKIELGNYEGDSQLDAHIQNFATI